MQCKEIVSQGTVRVGKLERSDKFDGEYYCWRHIACFFGKFQPTFEELKNADQLKWEDQQDLKSRCPGGGGAAKEEDSDPENEVGWCAEYAKSGRSTCRGCGVKIDDRTVRIGHTTVDTNMGYEMTGWFHPDCANLNSLVEDIDDISGWKSLKAPDKKKIEALMKKTDKKRKADEKEKDKEGKKQKASDIVAKQAADLLWNTKQEIESNYSRDEIRAILKLLKQSASGAPADCLARVADVKINGCLPACPECDNKTLSRAADKIICHGNMSEWSKCTWSSAHDAVGRSKCTMPSQDEIDDMVQDMKDAKKAEKDAEKASVSAALAGGPPAKKAPVKAKAAAASNKTDFSSMGVPALKAECKTRGLAVSGKKQDLIDRLEAAHAGGDDEEEEAGVAPKMIVCVDEGSGYTDANAEVYVDGAGNSFACVLNKTDLGVGTLGMNSFYKMQILQVKSKKHLIVYCRWGRVGQEGNTTSKDLNTTEAVKFFVKNFLEKTGNDWNKFVTGNFAKISSKFFPVEVDQAEEKEDSAGPDLNATTTLPKEVARFMRLIFDSNTILTLMKGMKIDTKKLPLGKLSKTQVSNGYEVLEAIEKELKKKAPKDSVIKDKSNQFYTLIPHDFGDATRPPPIGTLDEVKEKYDLLNVLGDIEVAAGILKKEKAAVDPLKSNYNQLNVDLDYVDPASEEFKIIETYTNNTEKPASHCAGWCMGSGIEREIIDVFRVNRHSEGGRYKAHDKTGNRKLLWHGTNAAVVAAIFQGGLRIMPHSGGRVGRGIYLASENNKSAAYVQATADPYNGNTNTGLMFLCEAALGKESRITVDDSSLVKAPDGFDSVLAMGQSEPDSKMDTTMTFDGREVIVPQGKPIVNPGLAGGKSNFTQSEYLVYQENQVRIRYILKMRWGSKSK